MEYSCEDTSLMDFMFEGNPIDTREVLYVNHDYTKFGNNINLIHDEDHYNVIFSFGGLYLD